MRVLTALGIVCCWVGSAAAQSPISPAQFRDGVAAALSAELPDLCITKVDDWTLHFGESEDACENQLAIDNTYTAYLQDPSRLEELQARLASTGKSIMAGPDLSDFENRVVVVLRDADYAAFDDRFEIVSQPFVGDVIAVLMLDSATTLAVVTPDQLAESGHSEEEAFALARRNLPQRMGDVYSETVDGMEVVEAESGLATGLLWLTDSCEADTEGSRAFVFDRNSFLRVGADDIASSETLDMVAAGMIADGVSLTRTIVSCREGSWVSSR